MRSGCIHNLQDLISIAKDFRDSGAVIVGKQTPYQKTYAVPNYRSVP